MRKQQETQLKKLPGKHKDIKLSILTLGKARKELNRRELKGGEINVLGKNLYGVRDLAMAGVSTAEVQIPTQLQKTVRKMVTVKEKELCYLSL